MPFICPWDTANFPGWPQLQPEPRVQETPPSQLSLAISQLIPAVNRQPSPTFAAPLSSRSHTALTKVSSSPQIPTTACLGWGQGGQAGSSGVLHGHFPSVTITPCWQVASSAKTTGTLLPGSDRWGADRHRPHSAWVDSGHSHSRDLVSLHLRWRGQRSLLLPGPGDKKLRSRVSQQTNPPEPACISEPRRSSHVCLGSRQPWWGSWCHHPPAVRPWPRQ